MRCVFVLHRRGKQRGDASATNCYAAWQACPPAAGLVKKSTLAAWKGGHSELFGVRRGLVYVSDAKARLSNEKRG